MHQNHRPDYWLCCHVLRVPDAVFHIDDAGAWCDRCEDAILSRRALDVYIRRTW